MAEGSFSGNLKRSCQVCVVQNNLYCEESHTKDVGVYFRFGLPALASSTSLSNVEEDFLVYSDALLFSLDPSLCNLMLKRHILSDIHCDSRRSWAYHPL